MQKKIKHKEKLLFWRILTYGWGILTALFFVSDFFGIINCSSSLRTITIIYICVLSIFTSVKEFRRWKDKKFLSQYKGEIFIIAYTLIMLLFLILEVKNPEKFKINREFTTAYLSILGIFAISYNSKYLKNKK